MSWTVSLVIVSAAVAASGPAQAPREVKDQQGRVIGTAVGLEVNPITIVSAENDPYHPGTPYSPTMIAHDFSSRPVGTPQQWQTVRADIVKRIRAFLGTMPPRDLPLDAQADPPADQGDYTTQSVTVAFDKGVRGRLCVVAPKGLPAPAPAVILYGAYDNGIDKMTGEVYSRAYAVHLARLGVVVVALDHWYDRLGTNGEGQIVPLAASIHMGFRAVDYLRTRKEMVHPDRIAVMGHVYGAEIAPFVAALDDRVAAAVTSCSSDEVITNDMHYWPGPVWVGRSRGLGCIQRYQPRQFTGTRTYEFGAIEGEHGLTNPKLPFLSQEYRAAVAPRPFLSIQENAPFMDSIRPVYALLGKPDVVRVITHRWTTNIPVVVQEYIVDFLQAEVAGVRAGKAPADVIQAIQTGLKSDSPAAQLGACRLASWWRPPAAAAGVDALIGSKDVAVRRAAAKALGRIGDMKRLLPHLTDADPVVRLAVAEAMHTHADTAAWEALAEHESDPDKWAREAKFQTMQINPEE